MNTSLFRTDKKLVMDTCTTVIDAIKKRREELYEEAVQYALNKRFFGFKINKTREKAIEYIKNKALCYMGVSGNWDDEEVAYIFYNHKLFCLAGKLFNAARICGEEFVFLSTEDANFIANYKL